MNIRKIKLEDAEQLLSYFRKLVELDPKRVERPQDVAKITLEMEVEWIKARIEDEQKDEMYVLCMETENGEIIAEGEVERKKRWIEPHVAEIRFGVLPGYEEHAKDMIEQLIQTAQAKDIKILSYFHLETQTKGIQLMKKLGFEEMGIIKDYYKLNENEFVDRIYLVKYI